MQGLFLACLLHTDPQERVKTTTASSDCRPRLPRPRPLTFEPREAVTQMSGLDLSRAHRANRRVLPSIRRVLVEIYGLHCHGVLGDVCHSSKTILFHRHQAAGRKHTRSRPPFHLHSTSPGALFLPPLLSFACLPHDCIVRGQRHKRSSWDLEVQ